VALDEDSMKRKKGVKKIMKGRGAKGGAKDSCSGGVREKRFKLGKNEYCDHL